MEEDIKIIEELIENERGELLNCWDYGEEAKRALENLLTRYKQLEEENKHYKKYAVMMTTEGLLINGVKFSFNDYIQKSKIKEIIEKHYPDEAIQRLIELLEEE